MRILFKKGKWLIGKDSIHLVIDIDGRYFYTDVKSDGTNFSLLEGLTTQNVVINRVLSFEDLMVIEGTKWVSDIELVNTILGENKTITEYKEIYK